MQSRRCPRNLTDAALESIEEAIRAVESCREELTADGYKVLRGRLGHLMDTLFDIGGSLSKST
ncbi:MAG: hypothetical protein BA861_04555 [Desulfobacterales bacterium S3730MH5]|nr:MAG: hypothetical protein BA861_04555 [Desulfobacterales bacterium S3730MH5]